MTLLSVRLRCCTRWTMSYTKQLSHDWHPITVCRACGTEVSIGRVYCDPCADGHQAEKIQRMGERSRVTLAKARAEGRDPAHGGAAANKRADSSRRNNLVSYQWDRENERPPAAEFTETILPLLTVVTVPEMMEATGLSSGYCSQIKRGLKVPHPRHWTSLKVLIGASDNDSGQNDRHSTPKSSRTEKN